MRDVRRDPRGRDQQHDEGDYEDRVRAPESRGLEGRWRRADGRDRRLGRQDPLHDGSRSQALYQARRTQVARETFRRSDPQRAGHREFRGHSARGRSGQADPERPHGIGRPGNRQSRWPPGPTLAIHRGRYRVASLDRRRQGARDPANPTRPLQDGEEERREPPSPTKR